MFQSINTCITLGSSERPIIVGALVVAIAAVVACANVNIIKLFLAISYALGP
jgi:hypothetical protein